MTYIKNFEDYEEKYYLNRFGKEIAQQIVNEYKDSIKETSCLGRFISPCSAKIRLPKWDESTQPGYDNPRKGFCTIEIGIGPDYPIAFYGFQSEVEYDKWRKLNENL